MFTKQGEFTQKPTDFPDVPSRTMTPSQMKAILEAPSDELKATLNKLVDDLNANEWVDNSKIAPKSVTRDKLSPGLIGVNEIDPVILAEPVTDIGQQAKFAQIDASLAEIAINVKSKGAKGDGVTDDTQAIKDAISALSTTGGIVFFPVGAYKFTSQLVIPNRVNLKGAGMSEAESSNVSYQPTKLLKDGNFLGIVLDASSSLSDVCVEGASGNGDGGIQLNGNRSRLENVEVANMGGDGVIVGDSLVDGNRNYWRMINVTSRKNGGRGFVINDYDPGTGPDTNAGYAEQCNAWTNTGDGWYIDNTVVCTFVQCYAETNGGHGWNVQAKGKNNTFLNCGSEGNAGEEFVFQASSVNNLVMGSMNFTPLDLGNNTILQATGGAVQRLNVSKVVSSSKDGSLNTSAITDGFHAKGAVPGVVLYETDAPLDEKEIEIINNAGNLTFRTTNDAGANPQSFIIFYRTGQLIDYAKFLTKLTTTGGLGVGNSVAATTLGTVTKKMQVFDADGNSIGYVPIYNTIT